jgi:hypothetical protein
LKNDLDQLLIQAEPAVAELASKPCRLCNPWSVVQGLRASKSWRIVVVPASERFAQAANTKWDLAQFEFGATAALDDVKACKGLGNNLHTTPLGVLCDGVWPCSLPCNGWGWNVPGLGNLDAKVKAQKELQKTS